MLPTRSYLYRGHLALHNTPEVNYPGVRGVLTSDVQGTKISNENQENADNGLVLLEKGTPVIIQPLDSDESVQPKKYKITPYKSKKAKNDALPESQRDVTTETSYIVELSNPDETLGFNNEHYRKSTLPLFYNDSPQLSDIEQFRTPNCFLLAAIQSILNHPNGKAFIRGMMIQNDDETTTVRLFDPETKKPVYITVENSYIVDRFGSLNWHPALWVHILEKAYVMLGKNKGENVDESSSSVFSGGGSSGDAMSILTGDEYKYTDLTEEKITIPYVPNFLDKDVEAYITAELDEETSARLVGATLQLKDSRREKLKLLKEMLGDNSRQGSAALGEYIHLNLIFNTKPDVFAEILAQKLPLKQEISKLKEAFKEELDARAIGTLDKILQYHLNKVPENTMSFYGSDYIKEYEHFSKIKEALKEGKLITTGTYAKLPEEATGIKQRHAYTVLDVEEKSIEVKDEDGNISTKTVCLLVMRNPWGRVGRVYDLHKDTRDVIVSQELGADIFKVELKDFCKYFSNYSISTNSLNNDYNKQKEDWLADVTSKDNAITKNLHDIAKEIAQANNQDWQSHFSELLVAVYNNPRYLAMVNRAYQKTLDQLINLELSQLNQIDNETKQNIHAILEEDNLSENATLDKIFQLPGIGKFKYLNDSQSESETKLYIFNLIKYQWYKEKDDVPQDFYRQFVDKISQRAMQYEPWARLVNYKYEAGLIQIEYQKKADRINDRIHELSDGIAHYIESTIALPSDNPKSIISNEMECAVFIQQLRLNREQLLIYVAELQKILNKLINMSSSIDISRWENALSNYQKAASLIDNQIRALTEMNTIQADLSKGIEEIKSTIENYHGSGINKDQVLGTLNQFQQNPTTYYPQISQMAQQYQNSNEKEVREIGSKMGFLANLGRKLKDLFIYIKDGFARLGLLFQTNKSYTIPPLPSEKIKLDRIEAQTQSPRLGG